MFIMRHINIVNNLSLEEDVSKVRYLSLFGMPTTKAVGYFFYNHLLTNGFSRWCSEPKKDSYSNMERGT